MEEWLQGEIRNRLSTNGICMVVVRENKVAGFNLATVGEGIIPLLRLRVTTAPDEAWSEQITIAREHRQKGLGSQLRKRFYSELAVRGIKALYGHRQIWNIASEKSARKYTSHTLVRAKYIRVLNYKRLKYFRKKASIEESETSPSTQDSPIVHTVYPGQTPRKDIIFSLNISDLSIRKEIPEWI
jgi:GNAT superfamily N-acetyltransferase